jgi:hypothetical protein
MWRQTVHDRVRDKNSFIEATREGWLGEVEGLQVSYSGVKAAKTG